MGSIFDSKDQEVMTIDFVRFLLTLYLLTYHIGWEVSYEHARGRSMFHYLLRATGLADIAIGAGTVYVLFIRHVIYGYFVDSAKSHAQEMLAGFISGKVASFF